MSDIFEMVTFDERSLYNDAYYNLREWLHITNILAAETV